MYLYLRTATGIVKIGSGAFSKEVGRIYGWLRHLSVDPTILPPSKSFSSTTHDARQDTTSSTSNSTDNKFSQVCREVVVKKRKAGIGMSLGVIDGAVCVLHTQPLEDGSIPDHVRDHLIMAGDHVIKVNDTEIDSLDVYSVILETTPEGESLNFTVQQTRANEEKRLSETSELATVIPAPPIPPRELTPGWLASIAVANPQNHSGMEKVLVQSERRAGIVSIIDTDSMDRIGSTPHRLVGGTLSSERDDDGSNIMPIFSDGILFTFWMQKVENQHL